MSLKLNGSAQFKRHGLQVLALAWSGACWRQTDVHSVESKAALAGVLFAVCASTLGCIGLWFCLDAIDLASRPGPLIFSLYGLQSQLAQWFLLLLALVWCAIASIGTQYDDWRRAPSTIGAAFVAVLGLDLLLSLAARLLMSMNATLVLIQGPLKAVIVLWSVVAVAYIFSSSHHGIGRSQWPRLERGAAQPVSLLALLLTLSVLQFMLPAAPFLYRSAPQAVAVSPLKLDVEQIYYRQRALVRSKLQAIAPEVPGTTDVFSVGFANNANEEVFAREIDYVLDVIGDRLNAQQRSIALINHRARIETHPLANAPNLKQVLTGLADRMNVEEDVLVLYLSSHGSRTGALAASFAPIAPNSLSAAELRQILDDSGIRWRIIVISACYSGSFVEPLRDAHSLVLTASSSERTSFGCTDNRRLTYFAEHLFERELARHGSWLEAFQSARRSLGERERREGFPESMPQSFVGSAMMTKLRELRWQSPNPATGAVTSENLNEKVGN